MAKYNLAISGSDPAYHDFNTIEDVIKYLKHHNINGRCSLTCDGIEVIHGGEADCLFFSEMAKNEGHWPMYDGEEVEV